MNCWIGLCNTYGFSGAKSASIDVSISAHSKGPKELSVKYESAQDELVSAGSKPTTSAQRLQLLNGVWQLLASDPALVRKKLEIALRGMPNEPETAHVYMKAASMFEQLQMRPRSIEMQVKALDAVSKRLHPKDVWIRPYLEKLKPNLTPEKNVYSMIDGLTDFIDYPENSHRTLDSIVSFPFGMFGDWQTALEITEIAITKAAVSTNSARQIFNIFRDYETTYGVIAHIPARARDAAPDLDAVGQFDCLLLQPGLQNAANSVAKQSGILSFDIQDNKIKNVTSTDGLSNGQCRDALVGSMSKLAALLPDRRLLHFKGVFDTGTRKIVLSQQLKNGSWCAPSYPRVP
jgi:hypothetical protein